MMRGRRQFLRDSIALALGVAAGPAVGRGGSYFGGSVPGEYHELVIKNLDQDIQAIRVIVDGVVTNYVAADEIEWSEDGDISLPIENSAKSLRIELDQLPIFSRDAEILRGWAL